MNYFTIDCEDWFQVYYARKECPIRTWQHKVPKIVGMIQTALEMLERHHTKATFFFVGELTKRHSALIRRVSDLGHEIGSHGYWHEECTKFSDAALYNDIRDSKSALQDAIGKEVLGYRAPGYTMDNRVLDCVQRAGYKYDSSVLSAQNVPYRHPSGLLEVPPNSRRIGRSYWPVNGGAFFRMVPYGFYRRYVQDLERKQIPLNFYIHSWELYPHYPRLALRPDRAFIQYFNLGSVRGKIEKLLTEFKFTSIEKALFAKEERCTVKS